MPSKDGSETPWEPLSLRERVYFALVRFLTWAFRVDFFDVFRRQDVSYDDIDEKYRIGMGPIGRLQDEWLSVYKTQAEFYDENDPEDYVPYAMWLVMRDDEIINPPVFIRGERNEDGSWDTEAGPEPNPTDIEKRQRKREILLAVDDRGFIDPVLDEGTATTASSSD